MKSLAGKIDDTYRFTELLIFTRELLGTSEKRFTPRLVKEGSPQVLTTLGYLNLSPT